MAEANNKARGPQPMSSALGAMLRASDGILDMLPIATFICDANGVILQYNSRAVEIWGRAPQPGQTHEKFNEGARYYELDGTLTERSLLADVLATGVAVRDAERIVERVDDTSVIASISIDPLRNAKGEVIG